MPVMVKSWPMGALAVLLAVLSTLFVVHGFASGQWMGGLLYASAGTIGLYEWATLRRSDDVQTAVDRMFVGVVVLMILLARPALDYLFG